MTYNPRTLQDLGTFWTAHGGVNLGVVGNQRHCRGYHLGKDRIMSDCACKPDGTCAPGKRWADYSVQTARDKAGLTNAASAIDLGRLGGSLSTLYRFSSWLARQCLDGAPGTADIREVIYSPDGKRVLGFKSGVEFLIPDYGDDSHLTHTHISFYRDSEARDKRALFATYFDLPDTSTEEPDVNTVVTILPFGGTYSIPAGREVIGIKFDPATGRIGEKKTWEPQPTGSSAAYDATVVTTAMRGNPFIRATNGFFAGYLISVGQVEERPNDPPPAPAPEPPQPNVLLAAGETFTIGVKG